MSTAPVPRVPSRAASIAAHRETGGRVAAVFPVHYPRALLRAFDLLPVEVWGPPGRGTTSADPHLQAYTCSVVRSGLSFLLTGGLDVADVVLVPHACDSLQGLGSVLVDFIQPAQHLLTFYLPRAAGAPSVTFLAREIRATYDSLAQALHRRPSDADLMAAVQREEAADGLLRELLTDRMRLRFVDREIYRVARAREYLPAERFTDLAQQTLALRGDTPPGGKPILLSGIVPEPMTLLDVIDEAGGCVAADDLACCGRRAYPAGSSDDPFERMAQSLLGGPPDSALGSAVGDRTDFLLALAAKTGAKGVLFHPVKFCEPELFYLPQLRTALDHSGLPSAIIEADVSDALPQQAVTRIEAFMETIS